MDPDEIPTRDGATFDGWYTDDGTLYVFSSANTVNNDITLHAKWVITDPPVTTAPPGGTAEIPKFTVSFETNGGSTVPSQSVRFGGMASNPGVPTKPGFFFEGWYEDDTFLTEYDFSKPVTGDIIIYANWVNPYTVEFETNGGNAIPSQDVEYGSKVIKPGDPQRPGYIFIDWYTDNKTFSRTYDFDSDLTACITLYAKWILEDMVWVEAGSFKMGTDNIEQEGEGPRHDVTITKDYFISRYEVTQKLYQSVMGDNPSVNKGDSLPVETVNWYEAVEFCNKLSEREGLMPVYTLSRREPANGYPIRNMRVSANFDNNGYRLPTEAEWEYAAKGGRKSSGYDSGNYYEYSGDNILDNVAWYTGNSGGTTHDDRKAPNELDIYDMSGNVWEWCWDWYNDNYYASSPLKDPTGPNTGTTRVMRGGCYSSDPVRTRSVNRWRHVPHYNKSDVGRSEYQGFRFVCNSP